MELLVGIAIGLVIGVVVGVGLVRLRPGGAAAPGSGPAPWAPTPNVISGPAHAAEGQLPVPMTVPASGAAAGLLDRILPERIAGHEAMLVQLQLTHGGLAIEASGTTYAHLADITDPTIREEARLALQLAATSIADQAQRQRIEAELAR